jgi:hypothetical protein
MLLRLEETPPDVEVGVEIMDKCLPKASGEQLVRQGL